MTRPLPSWLLGLLASTPLVLSSCSDDDNNAAQPQVLTPLTTLTEVASSRELWTGVAVSREGRIFVNFPRMDTDTVTNSVAEVVGGTATTPFPDATWNDYQPGDSPADNFICVQSVYFDDQNFLWVLDPASPQMRGVVPGGAKLLKFDLATRQLVQRVTFSESVVYATSYLNDVRVDTQRNVAYITDSGAGAIIVVNLTTGTSRRLLGNSPATKSENLVLTVENRVWRNQTGELPDIDSDGIALSKGRDYLYFHALTATGLYRVPTAALLDESLTASALNERVEAVRRTEPTDGMWLDGRSNLYLSAMQGNAVVRYTPTGTLELVAQSSQLKWPDTFAQGGADSAMYVTSSQLHIPRTERTEPFRLFRFTAP